MASGNKVIQYSRISDTVGASIEMDEIVVADAFGSGVAATHMHLDVHSDFAVGIDKLKITLVNGSTEYTFNQNLVDGEWINLDLNLATDFSSPVVQFDEIKLELGAGGSANDAATLNLDNVYFYKPISSVIQNVQLAFPFWWRTFFKNVLIMQFSNQTAQSVKSIAIHSHH